jgi:hypothetical protein
MVRRRAKTTNEAQGRSKSRALLRQRLKQSCSSGYLTLISIIQSAAVGYLGYVVIYQINHFSLAAYMTTLVDFLVVVALWNEYMMGAASFVWILGLRDSIIPFSLGIIEFFLIHSTQSSISLWCFFMMVFSSIAAIAYINMYCSASAGEVGKENRGALEALSFHKRLAIYYCLGSAMLFSLLWFWLHSAPSPGKDSLVAFISILMMVGFLVRASRHWRRLVIHAFQEP